MHAHDDRDQFIPPRPPGRGRAIALAVLAHLVLVGALTWGVAWKRDSDQPAVVAELWSAVPQQAAPRAEEPPAPPLPPTPPPPAPTPPKAVEPPPKPQPDPHEAEIALEREKRLEKEKREREAKQEQERQKRLKEQQRREQEQKAREKAAREKIEQAKEQQRLAEEKRKKEEALAKASEKAAKERRDQALRRMQGLANATGGANASGTALRDSGPSGSYGGKVAAKVKPNIVYPDAVADNLRAVVEVQAAPDGTITRTRLKESSGNKAWDDAVLRALQKTETLPRDVDGRVPATLEIGFRPRD
ncbi:MAG: cell envelope integrity protein TolA [Burkholderiaceae bacterium]|nr:cell envelope integrity protein TolA [Burkholderiaceae bacterium]